MTPIRVKTSKIRNLYVHEVLSPRCRRKILLRREARKPLRDVSVGDVLVIRGKRLRVHAIETCVVQREQVIEHVTKIATRAIAKRRDRKKRATPNVVRMPTGDHSVVGQFIRYHVLVRVYGGDPDAWLAQLRSRGADDAGDVRFVHWIRSRLRQDPMLIHTIRRMVESTPFWRAAALH